MTLAGALEEHAAFVVADGADEFDLFLGKAVFRRQGSQFIQLALDRPCVFAELLDHGGHHTLHGGIGERPLAGQLQQGQVVLLGDGADLFDLLVGVLDPAGGAVGAVVAIAEDVAGAHVIMEQAAVIHHAGEDFNAVLFSSAEHVLAGPGLEGIEDDHRPVHEAAELLEALDHVEGEAVGGAGGDAQAVGEALLLERAEGLPHGIAGVGDAVRVVQHEQVELGSLAALQRLLRGHGQVVLVGLRSAQGRVGEAGIAARTGAQALVEVVSHDACQAVFITGDAFERLAQQRISATGTVHVGRDEGAHTFLEREAHQVLIMLFTELFSVMHEASAAPCAVCRACQVHND